MEDFLGSPPRGEVDVTAMTTNRRMNLKPSDAKYHNITFTLCDPLELLNINYKSNAYNAPRFWLEAHRPEPQSIAGRRNPASAEIGFFRSWRTLVNGKDI